MVAIYVHLCAATGGYQRRYSFHLVYFLVLYLHPRDKIKDKREDKRQDKEKDKRQEARHEMFEGKEFGGKASKCAIKLLWRETA